jgi:hypothetical protein
MIDNIDEYVIQGLYGNLGWCLVYTCGRDFEYAHKVLENMLKNPTANDKYLMKDATEFRINKVKGKDCWWNENCD